MKQLVSKVTLFLSLILLLGCARESDTIPAASWQTLTPMNVHRSEMPAVEIEGHFYVIGGLIDEPGLGVADNAERYDPMTDQWELVASMPEPRHHLMAAGWNGMLFVFGGFTSSDWSGSQNVWRYDPAADTWHVLDDAPQLFGAGAAVTVGDFIYLVGGMPDGRSAWRYDPAADSWLELAPMEEAREHLAAAVLDGEIYVVAGRWPGEGVFSTIEIYDPGRDSWREGPALNDARSGHAVVAADGKLFAIGGELLGRRESIDSVEWLDPEVNRWEAGPSLPVGLHGVPALAHEGVVYVLGGSVAAGAIDNDGTVYSLHITSP